MGAARNLGDATNMAFTAPVLTPRVVNARFTYFVGGQVAIPPHASAYNGFSRGFNFTSNSDFNITQLSLPLDANVAGDTASYLVMINGAVAYRSIGNPGAVNLGLHVSVGDIVDVIGNWSPAAAGAFSAHNSYAFATPYQTFIAGIANTLNRTGWQWDIGDPNWTPNGSTGNYVQPATGSMGRIIMTGVVGTTVATATKLGDGCISRHGSVYEEFQTSASFDLTGHAITLFPVVGGGYTVSSLGTFRPVGSTSVPVVLGLGDDTEVTVPFTLGSFPGWTGVTVCSNGFVSKAVGNGTSFSPSVSAMLGASQDAFWSWHDFNPSPAGSGKVKIEQAVGLTVITWDGVWDFAGISPASANTLQFQLYASGVASIVWGTMSGLGNRHLVGFSPGGPSPDPGSTDLSVLGSNTISLLGTEVLPLTLDANRPVAGTNWQLDVTNVPATGVIGLDIIGLSDPGINDLALIGMPTCGMRASLDVLNLWLVAGPTHSSSLPVPNNLSLLNVHVFASTAVLQTPPINAFGAITSNGIDGKIGDS